jgi:hypothetical protein
MALYVGWRNFWWLVTALNIFTIACCIFLFPETKFHRPFGYADQKVKTADSPTQKISTEGGEMPVMRTTNGLADEENEISVQQTNTTTLTHTPTHQDPFLGLGKPSKQQWKLWQRPEGNAAKMLFREFILPWELCLFPIVEFAAFVVSWTASSFLTLNLTQSQAFAAPPYNFSSQTIGFLNFAILIGALIGLFTAGPLSDLVAAKLTMRNRGIREPEMRLLSMIPYGM